MTPDFAKQLNETDRFGLKKIDFTQRIAETSEMFSHEEAQLYINGCDYVESCDDLLLAWELFQRFDDIRKLSVMDAMCGPGRLGRELLILGVNHVVFQDGDQVMLNHALEQAKTAVDSKNTQGVLSPADHIPLPDECIDLIVCHNSIHQLESKEKLRTVGIEFLRLIKPGGILFIADYQRSLSSTFLAALDERLSFTKPEIIPLLLPTFMAAFSKDEMGIAFEGIKGIKISVLDAGRPALDPQRLIRVAQDPIRGHILDYSKISQRIIIKREVV